MQVFDNDYETANFHEDLQLFEAVWKSKSEKMADEDYRNEIVKQFDFIATKKFKYVLWDTREFFFTIVPKTQQWNNEIIVKNFHLAGVQKVAIVVTPDIFAEVSVQQTMEESSNVNFETQSFETREDAWAWLFNK